MWLRLIAFLAFAVAAPAQVADARASLYHQHIEPLFAQSCLPCHNGGVKQGGLDLSTREALLRGSEHGPVVTLGNPEASQLYKLVAHVAEPHMPFKGKKLPEEAIARIAEWIRAGAPYEDGLPDPDGVDLSAAASHWAFRQPVRQEPPEVRNPAWSANPIDRFLAAEHEARGLQPMPPADKRTLLRRAYLDLTGLPPTPEEVRAFEADRDPQAYEKAVDRLLAGKEYGERWGRHWLDVWRYSDWYGWRINNQVRYSQRHIWRWRDWTVESINANKPYDQMVREMIAGDEIAPTDPDTLRATGYLARNWYMFNRNVWLQDTIEYTATAFLGLTLKCARCHNHKYDPIAQTDYYRFRAFFEPEEVRTDRVPGEADRIKDGLVRVYDGDASRPTYRFIRGNEDNPDTSVVLQPGVPALFGKPGLDIQPIPLPVNAYYPDGRDFIPDDLRAEARAALEKAEAELKKAIEKPEPPELIAAADKRVHYARASLPALEARIEADLAAMATPAPPDVEELAEKARKLERQANRLKAEADLIAGNYEFANAGRDEKKLGAATRKLEAAVKALKEPGEGHTPIGEKYPTESSGRRLALARWIASKDNPLTARVAINHMWMRHFGAPLVATVFNFGRSGKQPTHPGLLDWLAVEFMENGWDMKAIHRLMVTSQAYRMASSGWKADAPEVKADPDNIYLWRMNTRRMEAEAVRDSLLAVAGELDRRFGGPEIDETKGHEIYRRSLYFRHAPDAQVDMLKVFDAASPNECFERNVSIVPQQALALANGKLSLTMARTIARSLDPAGGEMAALDPAQGNRRAAAKPLSDAAFVEAAFDRVLGRRPTAEELRTSVAFLRDQARLLRDPDKLTPFEAGPEPAIEPSPDPARRARESLVHVLFNHNDFVTIR